MGIPLSKVHKNSDEVEGINLINFKNHPNTKADYYNHNRNVLYPHRDLNFFENRNENHHIFRNSEVSENNSRVSTITPQYTVKASENTGLGNKISYSSSDKKRQDYDIDESSGSSKEYFNLIRPNRSKTEELEGENSGDEPEKKKKAIEHFIKLYKVLYDYPKKGDDEDNLEDKDQENTTNKTLQPMNKGDTNDNGDENSKDLETIDDNQASVESEETQQDNQTTDNIDDSTPIEEEVQKPQVQNVKKKNVPKSKPILRPKVEKAPKVYPKSPSNDSWDTYSRYRPPPPAEIPPKKNKLEKLKNEENKKPQPMESLLTDQVLDATKETVTAEEIEQLVFRQPKRAENSFKEGQVSDENRSQDQAKRVAMMWEEGVDEGEDEIGRKREVEGLPEATVYARQPYGLIYEKTPDGKLVKRLPDIVYEKLEIAAKGEIRVTELTDEQSAANIAREKRLLEARAIRKKEEAEKIASGELPPKVKDKKWTRGNEIDTSTEEEDLDASPEAEYGTTWKEFINTPEALSMEKTNPRGIIPGSLVPLTEEYVVKFVEEHKRMMRSAFDSSEEAEYETEEEEMRIMKEMVDDTEDEEVKKEEEENADSDKDGEDDEDDDSDEEETEEYVPGVYDDYSDGLNNEDLINGYEDGLGNDVIDKILYTAVQKLHFNDDELQLDTFGKYGKHNIKEEAKDKVFIEDNNYDDEKESDYDDGTKDYVKFEVQEESSDSADSSAEGGSDTESWKDEDSEVSDEEMVNYDDDVDEYVSYSDGGSYGDSEEDYYEENQKFKGVVSRNLNKLPYLGEEEWENVDLKHREGLEWNESGGEDETTDYEEQEELALTADTPAIGISKPPVASSEEEDIQLVIDRSLKKYKKRDRLPSTEEEEDSRYEWEASSDPEISVSDEWEQEWDQDELQREIEDVTEKDYERVAKELDVPDLEELNVQYEPEDEDSEAEQTVYRYPSENQHIVNIRIKNAEECSLIYGEDNPFTRKPPPPYEEAIGPDSYQTENPVYPPGYYEGIKEPTPESIKEAEEWERFLEQQTDSSDDEESDGGRRESKRGSQHTMGDPTRWQSWKAKSEDGMIDVLRSTARIWKPNDNWKPPKSDDSARKTDQWQHYRDWLMKQGSKSQQAQSPWPEQPKPPDLASAAQENKTLQEKSSRLLERLDHWQSYQSQKKQNEQEKATTEPATDDFVFKKPPHKSNTAFSGMYEDHLNSSSGLNRPEGGNTETNNPPSVNSSDGNNPHPTKYHSQNESEGGTKNLTPNVFNIKNLNPSAIQVNRRFPGIIMRSTISQKSLYYNPSSTVTYSRKQMAHPRHQILPKRSEKVSKDMSTINTQKQKLNRVSPMDFRPSLKISPLKPSKGYTAVPICNPMETWDPPNNKPDLNTIISRVLYDTKAIDNTESTGDSHNETLESSQSKDDPPENPKRKYTKRSKTVGGGTSDNDDVTLNLDLGKTPDADEEISEQSPEQNSTTEKKVENIEQVNGIGKKTGTEEKIIENSLNKKFTTENKEKIIEHEVKDAMQIGKENNPSNEISEIPKDNSTKNYHAGNSQSAKTNETAASLNPRGPKPLWPTPSSYYNSKAKAQVQTAKSTVSSISNKSQYEKRHAGKPDHFRHYQTWETKQAGGTEESIVKASLNPKKTPTVSSERVSNYVTAGSLFTSTYRPIFKKTLAPSSSFVGFHKTSGDHWQHYKDWLVKNRINKFLYRNIWSHPEEVVGLTMSQIQKPVVKSKDANRQPIIEKSTDEKIQLLHQRWLSWQQKLANRMVDKLNKRLRIHEAPELFSGGKLDPISVRNLIRQRDYWREIHRWSAKKTMEMYNKTPANLGRSDVPTVLEERPSLSSWPGKKTAAPSDQETQVRKTKWIAPDMEELSRTEASGHTEPVWPSVKPKPKSHPTFDRYRSKDGDIYPKPPPIQPATKTSMDISVEEKKEMDNLSVALGGQEVQVSEAMKKKTKKEEREETRKEKFKKNKAKKKRLRARTGT